MAKRKPLSFDSDQLTKDLKESAGKGVDAFFSSTAAAPPLNTVNDEHKVAEASTDQRFSVEHSPTQREKDTENEERNNKADKQTSKLVNKFTSKHVYLSARFNISDVIFL